MVQPLILSATPATTMPALLRQVRAARKAQPKRKLVVELAGGTYELTEPLRLTAADSGVIWRSQAGERAVFSGGEVLTGWRTGTVNGLHCWITDVAPGRTFTQLWVDGRRRMWPRVPTTGFHQFASLDGQADTGFKWMQGPQRAEFNPGDIDPAWRNRDEVRITAYQLWFETHHRIAEVDTAKNLVHFKAPSIGSLLDEKGEYARYVCENVFEALREPGSWYLDRTASQVYYLPKPGEDMELTRIVAPRLTELVVLDGTAKAPVTDVHFEQISFQHADFDRRPEQPGWVQAAYDIPGAIRLRWAENCVFYGCELAHLGQYGLQVEAGCVRPVIAACDFHDLGGGGVRVESEELVVHDSAVGTASKLVRPEPIAATVIDCQIRDIGHRYPSCVGIYLGNSGFHRVLHNHLQDIPYTGISSGWIWGYKPSRTVAVRIEHNRIHHINHRLLLSDNGAIYTLGRHPGGRIHGNWISDVGCYGYGGWGIYPDEGSSEFEISGNVVLRTRHAAFHMHYGRACHVSGNLFAGSLDAHVKLSRGEEHRSLTFTGNVITAADGSWDSALVLPTEQLLWQRNTIFDPRFPPLDAKLLADLQAQGQHRGLAIADPLVCDAAGGDPTPRSDSPVKGLGALVQRAARAGVRPQRSLPARFADYDLPSDEYYPIIETELTKVGDPLRHPDGSHQVRFRAVWRNPGRVKARAEACLHALGTCTLNGQTQVATTLVPGAEVVREVVMEVPAGVPQATLRSVPKAGPAVEHQIFVRVAVAGRKVMLPQLGACSAVDQVPALLASRPWEETRFGILGSVCAQLRFALAGQHLALHVIVPDARMYHGVQPWTGSCIEVFTAPAGGGRKCGQLVIQPSLPGVPARTLDAVGSMMPCEVPVWDRRTPAGYELATMIPLSRLGLAPDVTRFRMEIAITAARAKGAQAERSAWLNAAEAWIHGEAMAAIEISG